MKDIEVIRELHCYKMMYNTLQATITECIEKIELSEEYIDEQIKKIFHPENEKEDSEQ